MKKILISLLMFTLCIVNTGCSTNNESVENDKIKVISTIFPGYDFVKAIGGDNVDASILIPPGAESHSYEPSPQDIINIQNADLFIYTGGESDEWIDTILDSMDEKINTIKMIDCVDLIENEDHDHKDEHDHEDEENHEDEGSDTHKHDNEEYDEHVWTSPKNAIKISKKIEEELENIDSENKEVYKANLNKYIINLEKLDNEFINFFATVENKKLVFGDRFPLKYFAKDYGLEYVSAYTGCSTDVEPSVSTIASIIDTVKEENISTIFYIEFSNHKVADSIAESTNANTAMFHSCHNVSREDINNEATYISLMQKNLETLKEAMK